MTMDLNFIQDNIIGILGIIISVILACFGVNKMLKIKSNQQNIGNIKGSNNIINQSNGDINNSKR